jgi:hypothetical protein
MSVVTLDDVIIFYPLKVTLSHPVSSQGSHSLFEIDHLTSSY